MGKKSVLQGPEKSSSKEMQLLRVRSEAGWANGIWVGFLTASVKIHIQGLWLYFGLFPPVSLSQNSELPGWPAAKTAFSVFAFKLSAWNQNKKSPVQIACIISFNPHTMPVSRALLTSFPSRRNQHLELCQDHIFCT